MAGSVIALASKIPWAMLLDNAPAVIDGAQRLMRATGISRKRIPETIDISVAGSGQIDTAKLKAAVETLEASLSDLNRQMAEAAVLIKALAASNDALIKAGHLHRKLLIVLGSVAALGIALGGVALGV